MSGKEENKLVKLATDAAILMGITAGVGFVAKKMLKEDFLGDPSSNVMNYAKFTGVLAGSMALKTYIEKKFIMMNSPKTLPTRCSLELWLGLLPLAK